MAELIYQKRYWLLIENYLQNTKWDKEMIYQRKFSSLENCYCWWI